MRKLFELPFQRIRTPRWFNITFVVIWVGAGVLSFFSPSMSEAPGYWANFAIVVVGGLLVLGLVIVAGRVARVFNYPSNRLSQHEKDFRDDHPIQYLRMWRPPVWALAYCLYLLIAVPMSFVS